jgi:hypothetical protein
MTVTSSSDWQIPCRTDTSEIADEGLNTRRHLGVPRGRAAEIPPMDAEYSA